MEDVASPEDRIQPELILGWIKEAKARERRWLESCVERNSYGAGTYGGSIEVLEELERWLTGADE